MALPALLYLLGKALLPSPTGPASRFLAWYGYDILAGIFILGFANLLLARSGLPFRLHRPAHLFPFLLLCGVVWEGLAPLLKPTAVFDWYDFPAYLAGGALYYLLIGRHFPGNIERT